MTDVAAPYSLSAMLFDSQCSLQRKHILPLSIREKYSARYLSVGLHGIYMMRVRLARDRSSYIGKVSLPFNVAADGLVFSTIYVRQHIVKLRKYSLRYYHITHDSHIHLHKIQWKPIGNTYKTYSYALLGLPSELNNSLGFYIYLKFS